MDLPADSFPVAAQPWSGTAEATCDAAELSLVHPDEGGTMAVGFNRAG